MRCKGKRKILEDWYMTVLTVILREGWMKERKTNLEFILYY